LFIKKTKHFNKSGFRLTLTYTQHTSNKTCIVDYHTYNILIKKGYCCL